MALLALALCFLFIMWLFIRDNRLRPMTSNALWIPLIWIMINGSRHVSAWLNGGIETESPDSYLEGTPLDRNIYIVLILAAIIVLLRRNIDWSMLLTGNKWLFIFFLYLGVSTFWSDYPLISMKRWIKDMGNVLMILVIFTDRGSMQALRAVFSRYVSFAIPFSVLLILFFPELGSYLDEHATEAAFGGISTNKNGLGIILVVSGLFLAWDMAETWLKGNGRKDRLDLLIRILLFGALSWLMYMARSSTALVCLPAGAALLLLLHANPVRQYLNYLGIYATIAILVIFVLDFFPVIVEMVATLVGRDATFTGRTEIWHNLLRENTDPLVGSGYQSFWLQHGMRERYGEINQAHNGYLETYLNGGLIGLGLILAMIAATADKLRKNMVNGSPVSVLLFTLLVIGVLYNLTEGLFNGLSLIWFSLLLAALSRPETAGERVLHSRREEIRRTVPLRHSV